MSDKKKMELTDAFALVKKAVPIESASPEMQALIRRIKEKGLVQP